MIKIFPQQKEQTSLLARLRETNDFLMVEDKKVQPCDKERETENKVSALLIKICGGDWCFREPVHISLLYFLTMHQ